MIDESGKYNWEDDKFNKEKFNKEIKVVETFDPKADTLKAIKNKENVFLYHIATEDTIYVDTFDNVAEKINVEECEKNKVKMIETGFKNTGWLSVKGNVAFQIIIQKPMHMKNFTKLLLDSIHTVLSNKYLLNSKVNSEVSHNDVLVGGWKIVGSMYREFDGYHLTSYGVNIKLNDVLCNKIFVANENKLAKSLEEITGNEINMHEFINDIIEELSKSNIGKFYGD